MAKQIEKLTKDFAPLRKKAIDAREELKSIGVNRIHVNQMVSEAAAEITRRVQVLRNEGMAGTKLDDFRRDPEVKEILASVEDFKKTQMKAFDRYQSMRNAAEDATDAIQALRTKVDREVADRKKKRDRAVLPVDSASLPELEKLSGEMERVVHETRQELGMSAGWTLNLARHDRVLEEAVADTKANPQALRDQQAMDKQALGVRLLKANVQAATKSRADVKAACVEALRAAKAGDGDAARSALATAKTAFDALTKIVDQYDRAMSGKGEFDLKAMAQSKDGRTVLAAVKALADLLAEAKTEVATVTRSVATSLRS